MGMSIEEVKQFVFDIAAIERSRIETRLDVAIKTAAGSGKTTARVLLDFEVPSKFFEELQTKYPGIKLEHSKGILYWIILADW